MGPYLIHPDKLDAIHNIVLKQKARKQAAAGAQANQPTAAPASNNIVLKLMQNAYVQKREKLGRSY